MILVALLLAAFVINLDTTIVNVALPALVRELHATTTQLQWVVDAYNLVFAALLLTFGSLSDRFGRKGMLLAGLTVFGAASLAGGFAASPAELIAARAVMGLGAAMTFPATLSLISNVFTERRERARAIGLWGAIGGVAIALGPDRRRLAARALQLVQHLRRHGPGGGGRHRAGRGERAGVEEPGRGRAGHRRPGAVDRRHGAARVHHHRGAGLRLEQRAQRRRVRRRARSCWPRSSGWERRAAHPMLDVRLFRNMRFSAASGSVTIAFFTLFGFIFLMTQYFQFVRGYAPLSTGVHLLPVALSVGVGSVAGTQLAVRFGTKLIVTLGLVAMAGFYVWVAVTASATLSYGIIAVQMVVYGLGMGLTSAPATESIMGAVSRRQAGRRVGGQRHDPAARRHARRGRDRQRLRVAVRLAADRAPAVRAAGPGQGHRAPVAGRRVRGGRPGPGRRWAGPCRTRPPTRSCTGSRSAAWWPAGSPRPGRCWPCSSCRPSRPALRSLSPAR